MIGRGAALMAGAAATGRAVAAGGGGGVLGVAGGAETLAGAWVPAFGATGAAAATETEAAGAGILIVGAAVGLGGRLIRTVSFFGWILAASAGLGGTAPEGGLGKFSAIKCNLRST